MEKMELGRKWSKGEEGTMEKREMKGSRVKNRNKGNKKGRTKIKK